jgi:hypothetical protein
MALEALREAKSPRNSREDQALANTLLESLGLPKVHLSKAEIKSILEMKTLHLTLIILPALIKILLKLGQVLEIPRN